MKKASLKTKYGFAIILILLFVTMFYTANFYLVKNHERFAQDINLTGKERMLASKMLYYINSILHHGTQRHIQALDETLQEFAQVETLLFDKGYIFERQAKEEYIGEIRYFLQNIASYDTSYEDSIERKYDILIKNIDNYVFKVQNRSEESIKNILILNTLLFLVFLALVAFEIIYIFVPTQKEIENKTAELENTNGRLHDRIKAEVQKNKLRTLNMIQQSRLAQMGEMLSMIAHQWRQPLASISTVSGTLLIDIMTDNYKAEFFEKKLNTIDELANYLSSTIDDFRKFFKDNKELEPAQAKDIIAESLKIISPSIKSKKIEIITQVQDDIHLNTYVSELRQALLNLLKNAEDVLIDKKVQNPLIRIYATDKETSLEIDIEDNGGGIDPKIIDKIFDPYFSTKKAKDGSGLGLYMSKTIVEDHCHGKLSVENTEKGAKFTILIPLDIKKV